MSDAADRVRAALKRYPTMPTPFLEEWVRVGAALEIALEALKSGKRGTLTRYQCVDAIERMADVLEGKEGQ